MWPFNKNSTRLDLDHSLLMIEEAKKQPNGWVYVMDGNFGPNDAVPPERIKGAWKVDGNGMLTSEYQPNANYRPLTAMV